TLAVTENNYLIHYNLGRLWAGQGQIEKAIFHFSESIKINSKYHKSHNNLGIMLAQKDDLPRAIEHFREAIRINSKNENAHYNLGRALYLTGDVAGAIKHYRISLNIYEDSYEVLNFLSWILATHENPQFRNGPEALRRAQKACELTYYQNPVTLSTLAAAYAEVGRFPEAVETAQKAIDLYRAAGQNKQAESVASQQRLYQAHQPYRDRQ
ncbi:MAG: hypothetical protein AMJ79_16095, partial [Phycisphaerae bacterium SM23_30]